MELQVLKGADQIISAFKPIISFEQHIADFPDNGGESEAIKHLRSKGYTIFWTEVGALFGPLLFRRLVNKFNYWARNRELRTIVTGTSVPPRFHSMLIAIHGDYLKN